MRAVAYSIQAFEKEPLAIANHKKHDITLISNALSPETALFAAGKEAVIVLACDDLSEPVIQILADLGVKYIVTRSTETDHIDRLAAKKRGIKVANLPPSLLNNKTMTYNAESAEALQEMSITTIKTLDMWQNDKCAGKACACVDGCSTKKI